MTDSPAQLQPQSPGSADPPTGQPSQARKNPYVGPRALREGEDIFGRDRELRELLNRLIADRLVLLYSPSGAGKSSLVQAGLVPRMRKEKFSVLPTVRVGLEPPAQISLEPPVQVGQESPVETESQPPGEQASDSRQGQVNRYIFSSLLALEQGLPLEQQRNLPELAGQSLREYLVQRPRCPDEPSSRLLIFDQFEEILTQAPLDRAAKLAFFGQVGEALLDRDLWALFVIREDFLAGLDPYLPLIPTYLRSTFRLDLLESQPAALAIQKPADDQGIAFHAEAVGKLVDDLRRVWVQQPDGSQREEPGLYVEPVQLQVVCRRLYKELGLDQDLSKNAITAADVARLGDVNKALGEYYGWAVSEVAADSGSSERTIRDWFAERLISENLLRGQVLMGEGVSGGMDNAVIRSLEGFHLVRAENRRNSTWFELAHDRLVRPILEDNQAWAGMHLQEFQRRAAEWRKKDRPDSLLLHGRDFLRAEEWAQFNSAAVNEVDRELLEVSREWRALHISPYQRKADEWEQLGRPGGGLLSEAELPQAETWMLEHLDEVGPREMDYISISREAVAYAAVLRQEREVKLVFERQRAKDQELQNKKLRRRNFWLAALAALATLVFLVALYFASQFNTLAAQNAAKRDAQSTIAAGNAAERDAQSTRAAKNAAQAEDNASGATALAIERDQLVDQGNLLQNEFHQSQVTAQALRATSEILATQSEQNVQGRATAEYNASLAQASRLALLAQENFGKDPPLSALLGIAAYQAFPQSWEGRNALLTSLQVNTQQQVRPYGSPIQSQIRTSQSMAFSPDGKRLAWCGFDGKVKVWHLEQQTLVNNLVVNPEHGVNTLAFSPVDSNLLVSGSANGDLTFWDLSTEERQIQEAIYRGSDIPLFKSGPLLSLAFSPNGKSLAVSGVNGNVVIYDVAQRLAVTFVDMGNRTIRKLDWSPSGDRLAGAGYTTDFNGVVLYGEVYIWDLTSGDKADILDSTDELVYTLDWSPDGEWLAYAGGGLQNPAYPRTIVLHNIRTRQQVEISGQEANIRTLAFDQDGKILAAGSEDGTLRLWDVSLAGTSGIIQRISQPINNFVTRPPVQGLAFTPQGPNRLAYFTKDNRVVIFEIGLAKPLNRELAPATISQYVPVPANLKLDPVSGLLAIGYGADNEVHTLTQQGSDLTVDAVGSDFQASIRSSRLLSAALGPGSLVATGNQSGKIQVWDSQTGVPVWEQETDVPVVSLAFSQDGKQLAAGWCRSCSQQLYAVGVYEVGSERPAISLLSKFEIDSLAFSQDGAILAGGDSEGKIQLWDLQSQDPLGTSFGWYQAGIITALAFSRDGAILASGNQRGDMALWDVEDRRQIGQTFRAGAAPVTGLLFAPDGLSLVSAAQDGGLQRWDLDFQSWIERLCSLADPYFTANELLENFREQNAAPACTGFLQPTATPSP